MPELDSRSLERLIPSELDPRDATGARTHRLHVERYEFAAAHARPGRLLDIACGVGYGTRLLVDRNASVAAALGVDVSGEAIAYARREYAGPRLRFAVADAMDFRDAEGFDTIVSLETIEHLDADPGAFARRLAGMLRPGGVLVASAPTTPSVDVNPHHRRDFSARSFRRVFESEGFREISRLQQIQSVRVASVLRADEKRLQGARRGLPAYYLSHPLAALKRVVATVRHGFANHYLTVAWCRDER